MLRKVGVQSWVEESYRVGGSGPGSVSVTSSLYWAWVLIYKMWQISKTDPSCFGLTEYFCLVFSWTKLTERFFKNTPWPEAETIAPQVGNDAVFLILYKELYYRHIYAKVSGGPSLEQRFESYYNYCNLFNYILSESEVMMKPNICLHLFLTGF